MIAIKSLTAGLLLAWAIFPATTLAQHPLVLERLRAWDAASPVPATALLQGEVLKAAAALQAGKGGCIATSAVIERVSSAAAVRFAFNGILNGQTKNAWTVVASHPNCGTGIARYTVVRRSDDSLYAVRTNQGRSYANESLIGDIFPMAVIAAEVALKRAKAECAEPRAKLGVMRVASEAADLGPETYGIRYVGSWSETWPISLCSRTVEVRVDFTADGDGGAYHSIKEKEMTILPLGQ